MSVFKIIDIIEADYGCEEHPDGPNAILLLEDGSQKEVSEKWISENGIKEGKYISIKDDGSIMKAVR